MFKTLPITYFWNILSVCVNVLHQPVTLLGVKVLWSWPPRPCKRYCLFLELPGQATKSSPIFSSQNGHCAITKHAFSWMSFLIMTTFKDKLAALLMSMGFIWLNHSSGWSPPPPLVLLCYSFSMMSLENVQPLEASKKTGLKTWNSEERGTVFWCANIFWSFDTKLSIDLT